ncbi:phage tail tape measure protein [Serratia marcescens]|uniref:phage tail tape measure protein n=1 Tax=Serratia marcescens TaxID=615 RepID=UPI003ED8D418
MTDIASISLRVDTGDLQRGNSELDKFQKTAAGAAGAADGFNASGKETAKVSKEVAHEVEETHKRVAEYSRRLRETQTTATASGRAQDQLTESYFRQIDRIKQLGTGTQELRAIQSQVRAARAAGNITQNDYLTLTSHAAEKMRELTKAEEASAAAQSIFIQKLKDKVATQSLSREELLRYRAAQLGVGSAADIYIKKLSTAGDATHKFSLQTSAARRELGVMLGELARGNLGALRGSSITLANRSGLIEQMMTLRGLGIAGVLGGIAAAVYGLGKAWYQGSQEAVEFNKQLILTGNYAGKTSAQLQDMAKAMSGNGITQHAAAGVLAQVVGSGAFKSNQLETVARAAAAMQEATGQSVDATIKNFQKLYDSPTKASEELNNQLHYLTSAQYEYISSLEKRGYKEAAGEAAAKAYSEAERQRSKQVIDNLGFIEAAIKSATNRWNEFWDAAMNVGRPMTEAYQLEQVNKTINQIYEDRKKSGGWYSNQEGLDKLLQQKKELEFVIKSQQGYVDSVNKAKEADDGRTKSLQYQNEILSKNQSWQQKRTAALTELWQMVAKAPKDWSDKDRKIAVAQINADNKPSATKKGPQYRAPAGDLADEKAQADLLALQAQLKVLQEHRSINDTISQQRKDLWAEQAKFAVLEQAADKRKLTAQEQSLLSSKDSVLAQKERLAVLGDEIAKQERLNKLQDASSKYVTQMSEKRQALSESAGLSDRDARRRMEEAQLAQGWQNQGGSPQDDGYKRQLQAARDFYAEEDKLRADWKKGALKGWNEYLDSATNVYSSVANVANAAFTGLSDTLTSLATTGSANVKSFGVSMLKMVVDVINKLLVAYAVQAAMGWLGSSASIPSNGQNVPSSPGNISTGKFDTGGYTGDGGKYEPKGIVHGGEFVFTKEATRNIGVGNLYAMMHSAQGYADGGYVGNAPMHGLTASGGGGVTVDIGGINFINQNTQQQPAGGGQRDTAGIQKQIKAAVIETINDQSMRPGTPLWNALNKR